MTRTRVLSHAEVWPSLGVMQRGKWDITWLPDMATPGDPIEVGDRLRAMVRERLGDGRTEAEGPDSRMGGGGALQALMRALRHIFGASRGP